MQPPYDNEWRHLERRCEGHDMSPSLDHPIADVMVEYEWKNIWISNEVTMMSMKINVELIFMDLAPMLMINELEKHLGASKSLALDNKWMTCGVLRHIC